MSASPETSAAQVSARTDGDGLVLTLSGHWRITGTRPHWVKVLGAQSPQRVRLLPEDLAAWDSSLLLFLHEAQQWCRVAGVFCDITAFPEQVRTLLAQFEVAQGTSVPFDRSANFLSVVGVTAQGLWQEVRGFAHFMGEFILSAAALARQPRRFRWRDCVAEMQQCGAMALPIVSLTSFLVGVTLAYTGAIILRLFGGDIWVADLVGLSTAREMGAVMTAVVLAGRTGAAYAAQIGNMKANEEIDALATLGVSPVDFLVVPRVVALAVMTPLLALYANCLGILGGMAIARTILDIPPTAYWVEMLTIVDLSDIATGLIKAVTFGLIIGLSGCMRGMQADRSAAGVGRAATSAVVTAILLMIIADALFAVVFHILGW
ncbi:MAG TPA: ABC transporter permease [Opitutaceae bacterium]|nr:ABC transporter permease [Opitutaceae bacterium]